MTDEMAVTFDREEMLGRVASTLRRADLAVLAAKEPPLRKVGVSGSLYAVLANLGVTPGLTGAELARVVGVTPQAITPLVVKLVERGLIERRTHPRHSNIQELQLTDSGRRETARADRIMLHLDNHIRDSLGTEDYQRLRVLLDVVIKSMPSWVPPPDEPS
ncbi:MarR family winged helix-turn-helix transcriptional regulator [Polymorphospora rubra]|uniref:MarR family winged helix-turn-helix transcriptional regulator n=1 Tax=Polymorphospora rubra TaxID=338584 RepID=UPI001BB38358|nr:MarR family transcriptional regulator [Polymorphospora rubra]